MLVNRPPGLTKIRCKQQKSSLGIFMFRERHQIQTCWFPQTKQDLDYVVHTSEDGGILCCDHPGFNDPEYRKRRKMIADKALQYKYGDQIPVIEYTAIEESTWRKVYQSLRASSRMHAVDEYNVIVDEMEKSFGFGPDRIPQLHEVHIIQSYFLMLEPMNSPFRLHCSKVVCKIFDASNPHYWD